MRDYWPPSLVAAQLRGRWLPSLNWPLRPNAAQQAGLMPSPVGEEPLPGLPDAVTRPVPPPVDLTPSGTALADSTYPG